VLLSSADVNPVGRLEYKSAITAAVPVWGAITILPGVVYDALIGGTDRLQVETMSLGANAIAAAGIATGAVTNAKLAAGAVSAGVLAANAKSSIGTAVWLNATKAITQLPANAISAPVIATGAITNAKYAVGAISGGTFAATGKSSIGTAVWLNATRAITVLPANAISAPVIATGALTNAKLAAGAISAGVLAVNTIAATKIAADNPSMFKAAAADAPLMAPIATCATIVPAATC